MKKIYQAVSILMLLGFGTFSTSILSAQPLTFDTTATALQMANALAGNNGVTIANVTSTCATRARGTFTGGMATLGMANGIILTSGGVLNPWPLNSNQSNFQSLGNGTGGDPDLFNYGVTTIASLFDKCVLEFDVTPICDTIRFRYVFGSEEYPDYVNSASFVDAFAFFISGPGYPVGTNIARIPIVNSPININTVNNGQVWGCPTALPGPCMNCLYYINNCGGTGGVLYDGYTSILTAQAIVTACQTYHVKLSIADGGDSGFDSGVFLETGTLACSGFTFTATSGDTLIEGCQDAEIDICHLLSTTVEHTIHFTIGGTATMGVDYLAFPDSITIPIGSSCTNLSISIINDLITEGQEYIELIYQPNSCSPNDTLTIWLYDPIAVSNSADVTTCSADSVLFGEPSVPGYTYNWAPIIGLNNPLVAQPTAFITNNSGVTTINQYILTATAGSCISYDTVIVFVSPAPLANAGANVTFCEGQSVVIGSPAAAGDVYSWAPPTALSSTTIAQPTVNSTNLGATNLITSYVLTVTNPLMSCTSTDTIVVTEKPTDWATMAPLNPVCLDLPAFPIVGGSPVGLGGVYTGTGVTGSNFNPSTAGSGVHTIYYTYTNSFGCPSTDSTTITVNPLPVVNAGVDITLCEGFDASITASGSSNITNWIWSPTTFLNNSAVSDPIVLNPNPAGTHPYTITVTDVNLCVNTDVIDVIVSPSPIVNAGPDQSLCIGSTAGLNATGALTYEWTPATNLTDAFIANPITNTLVTITYSVVGTDQFGCLNNDEMTININLLPVMAFSSVQDICVDAPTVDLTQGSPTPGTYSGSGISASPTFDPALASPGSHTIMYSYTNPTTNCTNSALQTIVVNPLPAPVFTFSPQQATLANAIISFTDQTAGATDWIWNYGDGTDSVLHISNPSHTYNDTGTFNIILTAINQFGCDDTTSESINIGPDMLFYLPSAFTPNDDGKNDYFFGGSGFGFYEFSMLIFDRWGNQVFTSRNHNEGWNGNDAPPGVYVYKVNLKDFDGRPFEYVGHVSLIR